MLYSLILKPTKFFSLRFLFKKKIDMNVTTANEDIIKFVK